MSLKGSYRYMLFRVRRTFQAHTGTCSFRCHEPAGLMEDIRITAGLLHDNLLSFCLYLQAGDAAQVVEDYADALRAVGYEVHVAVKAC